MIPVAKASALITVATATRTTENGYFERSVFVVLVMGNVDEYGDSQCLAVVVIILNL